MYHPRNIQPLFWSNRRFVDTYILKGTNINIQRILAFFFFTILCPHKRVQSFDLLPYPINFGGASIHRNNFSEQFFSSSRFYLLVLSNMLPKWLHIQYDSFNIISGNAAASIIAIDDITLKHGPCNGHDNSKCYLS